MATKWNKFTFDELLIMWKAHKLPSMSDPLCMRTVQHRNMELTKEELEELVEHLLTAIYDIKQKVDNLR